MEVGEVTNGERKNIKKKKKKGKKKGADAKAAKRHIRIACQWPRIAVALVLNFLSSSSSSRLLLVLLKSNGL